MDSSPNLEYENLIKTGNLSLAKEKANELLQEV